MTRMEAYIMNPVGRHKRKPRPNAFGGGDLPGPGPPQSS
jgi:hypothetical protein